MRLRGGDGGASDSACWALVEQGVTLNRRDTLQKALPMFDRLKSSMIPVVDRQGDGPPELIGAVFHVDALKAFNRALVDAHREEHS